jgi:hypothetical protein
MQLFRQRPRLIVTEAIGFLVIMLALVAWPLLIFENKGTAYLVVIVLVPLWLLFAGTYLWNLYRKNRQNWLQLDEETISGMLDGTPFRVAWKDVLAVSQRKEILWRHSLTTVYLVTKQEVVCGSLGSEF